MTMIETHKFRLVAALIILSVLATGCAGPNQQREEQAIYHRINVLEQKQAALQRESSNTRQKLNADTNIRLDNLERELKLLSESVEDALARPEEVKSIDKFEFEEIIANLEKRIQLLESGTPPNKNSVTSATNAAGNKTHTATPIPTTKSPSAREKALYDDAYSTFKRGNFKIAKDKFKKFITTFPSSTYRVNSQFWIGECYYKIGDYAEAIIKYDEIIADTPQHQKAASALLKQGFAFLKLGDATDGKLILSKVITNYPKSDQAEIARRKLKTIK
ncbi:MAG: tol-pal system protein YbgF [Deltaproteobacteria bacterium]|nr:MAG: tol-pal system protein YbgF [Deltaproteobacteria bacterium]